jgi:dUTP pyrophosphatase
MKIKRLHPDAILPTYANPTDSGMDLVAIDELTIEPGKSAIVPTGISIELPQPDVLRTVLNGTVQLCYEAQIRSRSGLAAKNQIAVLNSPGTIDEGYRGEIKVILINHSFVPFEVKKGMRIAQMIISTLVRVSLEEVSDLSETKRGANGFGSTGI